MPSLKPTGIVGAGTVTYSTSVRNRQSKRWGALATLLACGCARITTVFLPGEDVPSGDMNARDLGATDASERPGTAFDAPGPSDADERDASTDWDSEVFSLDDVVTDRGPSVDLAEVADARSDGADGLDSIVPGPCFTPDYPDEGWDKGTCACLARRQSRRGSVGIPSHLAPVAEACVWTGALRALGTCSASRSTGGKASTQSVRAARSASLCTTSIHDLPAPLAWQSAAIVTAQRSRRGSFPSRLVRRRPTDSCAGMDVRSVEPVLPSAGDSRSRILWALVFSSQMTSHPAAWRPSVLQEQAACYLATSTR